MALLLPLDLAQSGSLFEVLSRSHVLSGLFAVLMMSLGVAAIVYRAKRRFALIEPGSVLILLGYALALWLLATSEELETAKASRSAATTSAVSW